MGRPRQGAATTWLRTPAPLSSGNSLPLARSLPPALGPPVGPSNALGSLPGCCSCQDAAGPPGHSPPCPSAQPGSLCWGRVRAPPPLPRRSRDPCRAPCGAGTLGRWEPWPPRDTAQAWPPGSEGEQQAGAPVLLPSAGTTPCRPVTPPGGGRPLRSTPPDSSLAESLPGSLMGGAVWELCTCTPALPGTDGALGRAWAPGLLPSRTVPNPRGTAAQPGRGAGIDALPY